MKENYYHILGLDNFASEQEVKMAYRKLAKKYHPDRHQNDQKYEEIFKRVSLAYNTLSNGNSKFIYDERLRASITVTRQGSQRPNYKKAPYYSTKKREYTPQAWFLGKVFIIVFLMAIILIPIALLYYSSVRHYERAVENYNLGKTADALLYFNRAISSFGGRSVEASIASSTIYHYDLHNGKQTIFFADKGLEYAEKSDDIGFLYFLKALGYRDSGQSREALKWLEQSQVFGYANDSIRYYKAMIQAFEIDQFREARIHFDKLISDEVNPSVSWFGKAWCHQNLRNYNAAIKAYTNSIKIDSTFELAYFYRGISHLNVKDSIAGCADIKKAEILGYEPARSNYAFYCMESPE